MEISRYVRASIDIWLIFKIFQRTIHNMADERDKERGWEINIRQSIAETTFGSGLIDAIIESKRLLRLG